MTTLPDVSLIVLALVGPMAVAAFATGFVRDRAGADPGRVVPGRVGRARRARVALVALVALVAQAVRAFVVALNAAGLLVLHVEEG